MGRSRSTIGRINVSVQGDSESEEDTALELKERNERLRNVHSLETHGDPEFSDIKNVLAVGADAIRK
jgi:hypothetical protein